MVSMSRRTFFLGRKFRIRTSENITFKMILLKTLAMLVSGDTDRRTADIAFVVVQVSEQLTA